jgi:hypothetical protein
MRCSFALYFPFVDEQAIKKETQPEAVNAIARRSAKSSSLGGDVFCDSCRFVGRVLVEKL